MSRSALLAVALAITLAPTASDATMRPATEPAAAGGAYVLLVHGGGWRFTGPRMVARMDPAATRLQRWGYRTENVDYRPGADAFGDVLAAYRQLRARVGAAMPVCVYGASAGGQMALMLAIRRPEIACVIAQAAPSLLEKLGPRLRRAAHVAFDPHGGLRAWSPARYALAAPALLEQARHDPVVPFAQSQAMRAAALNARLIALEPGSAPWVHTRVAASGLARAAFAERNFLRRSIAAWSEIGPRRTSQPTGVLDR
jgi:dienelactone hydrolase